MYRSSLEVHQTVHQTEKTRIYTDKINRGKFHSKLHTILLTHGSMIFTKSPQCANALLTAATAPYCATKVVRASLGIGNDSL